MQQHVFLADRREHVAFEIGDPFGHARGKAGPQQVGAGVDHHLAQIGHADHAIDLDQFAVIDAQFRHHRRQQLFRRAGRIGHPHHLAAAAPFQRHLEFAHQVFGLFLDFQVAVAQDAEFEIGFQLVAGKQAFDFQQQQLFQRQEPVLAGIGGQAHEAADLGRDRQQRLQAALVAAALQFQRQRVSGVRDEREGMRRVDGQRRQHRKNLVEKELGQEAAVIGIHLVAGQHGDAGLGHFAAQRVQGTLLGLHQLARILADQHQLFRRA